MINTGMNRNWIVFLCSTVLLLSSCQGTSSPVEVTPLKLISGKASDIEEFSREEDFLSDYTYYLKATVSQKQFGELVYKLDLIEFDQFKKVHSGPRLASWYPVPEEVKKWWNPSEEYSSSFLKVDGDKWILAKYENSHLFYYSFKY